MSWKLVHENKLPYKGNPVIVPNHPEMIDPTRNGPQICLAHGFDVRYQGDLPRVNDVEGWQVVIQGLRTCRALPGHDVLPLRLQIIERGIILRDTGCPAANDLNAWHAEVNALRLALTAPRQA